ncbi:MAG: alpha/beta hydrolase fold domain-containing protein [Acidimicrobiia bacterium]
MISWAFLAVSIVGAAFTVNAYRPSSRWQLLGLSFFAGWLTGELALFHLAWQLVATVVFVSLGALDDWPGVVGLAVSIASWIGLVWIQVVALRSARVMERALRAGLGDDYRSQIAPGLAERLARRPSTLRLLFPFYLRDRKVERVKNVQYAPGAGRRHRLDVYRPRAGVDGAPVLLQIHGGAWVIGDKGQQGLPLMLHLAARGWVCVANNYRLSPRAKFPDHLVDCKLALRWVREHVAEYGGNPDFVVVTGGSAGGHLAALVALTANDPAFQPGFEAVDTSVSACVPFYGVYDLADVFEGRRGPARASHRFERMLMGTTVDDDRAAFEQASPLHHVSEDDPPFFVIHGANDNLVPVAQARQFVAALSAVSREPVLYAEVPGASHAFEIFNSVRTANAVFGVERFLAWLYSAYRAQHPEAPAEPVQEAAG